ncbi:MAG: septum formation initiator family protein [bacterium]|nr:septum formation initiator family protein [bacterium]
MSTTKDIKKRFVLLILFFFGLYLIVSFSRDLWGLWQKSGEMEKSQLALDKLKIKNEELKKQLEYVNSDIFIEKEARDKLGLGKAGETILILPENLEANIGVNPSEIRDNLNLPNWEKWWRLFF